MAKTGGGCRCVAAASAAAKKRRCAVFTATTVLGRTSQKCRWWLWSLYFRGCSVNVVDVVRHQRQQASNNSGSCWWNSSVWEVGASAYFKVPPAIDRYHHLYQSTGTTIQCSVFDDPSPLSQKSWHRKSVNTHIWRPQMSRINLSRSNSNNLHNYVLANYYLEKKFDTIFLPINTRGPVHEKFAKAIWVERSFLELLFFSSFRKGLDIDRPAF